MGHKGKARGRFSVSHQTCFSSGAETDQRETHRHKSRTKKLRQIPRDAATTRGVSLFTRRERGVGLLPLFTADKIYVVAGFRSAAHSLAYRKPKISFQSFSYLG